MTLWIGVEYDAPWYYLVGVCQSKPIFFKQLSPEEWMGHPLIQEPHQWVVSIPIHAVALEDYNGPISSTDECLTMLKQRYGAEFTNFNFSEFYLGLKNGRPYWSIARVSKVYLQEYLLRFENINRKIAVIEWDVCAIWLYIYYQFHMLEWGCVFYQQKSLFYALLGRQERCCTILSENNIHNLVHQVHQEYPWVGWCCFFSDIPNVDVPWIQFEIGFDSIWRKPLALAFRGEYNAH